MRSQAREKVFEYIFSTLFNNDDEGLFNVLIKDLDENDKNFASNLLKKIIENKDKYDVSMAIIAKNYKFARILSADKCAIYIGMAELSEKSIPVAVAIDEAVKLSAKYSTEKSTDFVNGILAEYVREISND